MTPKLQLSALAATVDSLLPFQPQYSSLLNEQHFYQNSTLRAWTEKNAHPVTLSQLANFGKKLTKEKVLASANFCRQELPTRLSLKVREMQQLDYQFTQNHHLNQVYQSYYYCWDAFRRTSRIDNLDENDKFCQFLSNVLDDHLIVLPHLMMGSLEASILQTMPQKQLDEFISSMIRSRISRRVIMEQHISLSKSFQAQKEAVVDRPENYIGTAFERCSAHEHLKQSAKSVLSYLRETHPQLKMPELIVVGPDVKFQFLTAHLNYIFTEILRNAFKATVNSVIRRNPGKTPDQLRQIVPPPVVVEVSSKDKTVSFKFSDQGGGMPESRLAKVWSFGKSPELAKVYLGNFHRMSSSLPDRLPILDHRDWKKATPQRLTPVKPKTSSNANSIMNNLGNMEAADSTQQSTLLSLATRPFNYTLGISLPMCKVYTDWWNGTLDMYSVWGYGSDVYLTLQKTGTGSDKLMLDHA